MLVETSATAAKCGSSIASTGLKVVAQKVALKLLYASMRAMRFALDSKRKLR
jgi:hypothetical protein